MERDRYAQILKGFSHNVWEQRPERRQIKELDAIIHSLLIQLVGKKVADKTHTHETYRIGAVGRNNRISSSGIIVLFFISHVG